MTTLIFEAELLLGTIDWKFHRGPYFPCAVIPSELTPTTWPDVVLHPTMASYQLDFQSVIPTVELMCTLVVSDSIRR
jgi:hypothetical protein